MGQIIENGRNFKQIITRGLMAGAMATVGIGSAIHLPERNPSFASANTKSETATPGIPGIIFTNDLVPILSPEDITKVAHDAACYELSPEFAAIKENPEGTPYPPRPADCSSSTPSVEPSATEVANVSNPAERIVS